jgi:hypothetical protein
MLLLTGFLDATKVIPVQKGVTFVALYDKSLIAPSSCPATGDQKQKRRDYELKQFYY